MAVMNNYIVMYGLHALYLTVDDQVVLHLKSRSVTSFSLGEE